MTRSANLLVLAVGATLLAPACQASGATKDEIDRLVDQRLAERGLAPSASASSSGASSSGASARPTSTDPAAASLAFLARLDDMMKDYKPELPVMEDKSDLLRCVTTDAAKTDPQLKKAVATLNVHAASARAERDRKAKEFHATTYPLAFRYDLDWATRKGASEGPAYGCWDKSLDTWLSWTTEADCSQGGPAEIQASRGVWKLRSAGGPGLFVYSNSETPPSSAPELMRRMQAAGLEAPSRFVCRVEDVLAPAGGHDVRCRSNGPVASVRVTGELRLLNVGDLVSVPAASTRRDPNGVLLKKGDQWVVDADAKTLTVDVAAACPSVDEILSSATGVGK